MRINIKMRMSVSAFIPYRSISSLTHEHQRVQATLREQIKYTYSAERFITFPELSQANSCPILLSLRSCCSSAITEITLPSTKGNKIHQNLRENFVAQEPNIHPVVSTRPDSEGTMFVLFIKSTQLSLSTSSSFPSNKRQALCLFVYQQCI